MPTPSEVTITVHREPPSGWKGKGENIGHLRAVGPDASVSVPCSLALLDDPTLVEHYIKERLLLFYEMETERVRNAR